MRYPYHDPSPADPEPFVLVMDDDNLLHILHPERSTACGVEADGDTTDGGPEDVDCDRCLTLRSEDYTDWLAEHTPTDEEIVEQAWEKVGHGWQKQDEAKGFFNRGVYVPVSKEMMRDAPKDVWENIQLTLFED